MGVHSPKSQSETHRQIVHVGSIGKGKLHCAFEDKNSVIEQEKQNATQESPVSTDVM